MTGSAIISECGLYRYTLHRHIRCMLRWVRPCLFIMLNPSTATGETDDPTIRACMEFCSEWQCTSLTVVNLFAYRSTDPDALDEVKDPIGPDNLKHLQQQFEKCRLGVIVAAWGAHPAAALAADLQQAIRHAGVQCLGMNKNGSPKHPLYVARKQPLVPWQVAA